MSDIERHTDIDLVAAYRAGDTDAFAEIYDRHSAEVFSYFLERGRTRSQAADGANDTFLEASSRLDLDESPQDLRSWLLGIAAGFVGGRGEEPGEVVPAPPALRPRVLDKVEREVASAFSARPFDPEWSKIGMFAVVTVIVGLIGLAISAQVETLDPQPTVPGTQPPVAAPTTTTSIPEVSTTASGGGGGSSTSSTAAAAPAAIEVSTDTVNFGGDGTVNEIDVSNTGGRRGEWEITSSSEAIAISQGQGELPGGETVTIELQLDRENIPEGDLEETITVTWSGGQYQIAVVGSHEDNPIIHNPLASPASIQVSGAPECTNTKTTITARVRDTSPLESVVVQWSPDGGAPRETAMAPAGEDMFEAVIGPFTVVGTTEARIVAFDERGNAGGATTPVTVVECP
jgi:hypothetical protein